MIGTKLAHYEITSHLGTGGMGEVYQATDSKLGRSVAIKLLPAAFASDPDRLSRFRREAQLLASLNHPNIAHIYGLEESGDTRCIVMELIEGETLQARIKKGPIPVDEALTIAKQIAEALEAAHEKGVIHRDLKPGNVMLTADGRVKVLDFGLAKAYDTNPSSATSSNSPTMASMAATNAGVILGTAAYMTPEQARGKTVDKRADIWAFGAVLFEMLTGQRAFPGDDLTDMIVSVVSKEPDWLRLPAATPAGFRRLLTRCLKKEPRTRLRDIGEARVQIDELLSGLPDETVTPTNVLAAPPSSAPRSAWSRTLTWMLAASTIGIGALALLWAPWRAAPSPRSAALQMTPFSFEQGGQTVSVWSPDGKAVSFGARQKDTDPYQVYVRYVDSAVATPITHLAGNATPIQWTSSGRIVFISAQAPSGLWSVSPVGGEPVPLQAIDRPGVASVSRDGTALAWLHQGEDGVFNIWVSSPPGSAPKPYEPAPFTSRTIFNAPTVKFSPDGKQILMFRNANNSGEEAWLMPYPADAAKPPHRILHGMPAFEGTPTFSWMPDNRHIVLSATPGGARSQLYIADTVSGAFVVLSGGTTEYWYAAVSPDGARLVFAESIHDGDVVSVDLASAAVTPLIATQRTEQMPAWAARESALVYVTDRNGAPEIWLHKPGQADRPISDRARFSTRHDAVVHGAQPIPRRNTRDLHSHRAERTRPVVDVGCNWWFTGASSEERFGDRLRGLLVAGRELVRLFSRSSRG